MNRLFTIPALTIFGFQFFGMYGYFVFRSVSIQQEMQELLRNTPQAQFQQFVFTKTEFSDAKVDDDELRVNGKMFDVAGVNFRNGSVIVYALSDPAEDELFAFLGDILENAPPDQQHAASQLIKLMTLHYLQSTFIISSPDPVRELHSSVYHFSEGTIEPPFTTPPPEPAPFRNDC
jgi:hypothetical protein